MKEDQPIKKIEVGELLAGVQDYKTRGYRLVHICCTKAAENNFDVSYVFDKEFHLESLRINVSDKMEIPSVTKIYKGAFLYENEINELFGVNIAKISLDFKGHLYKKAVRYPFSVNTDKVDKSCQKE